MLSGTVATGAPISGANVTVLDSASKSVTATADAGGNYQVSLTGLTLPFAVFATDPTGIAAPLTSVVASLPTGSSGTAIANVTTLTTAVAALLTPSGNPLDLTDTKTLSTMVTPTTVGNAVKTLNAAIGDILSENNVAQTGFDPVTTPFVADRTGADAALDSLQLVPSHGASGGFELISIANPNSSASLTLNSSTTVSAPLPAATVSGDYLDSAAAALTQCLGGDTASCTNAIDANYKENGFTTFRQAHPALVQRSVKVGKLRTLEFMQGDGGTPKALVAIPYTAATGASGFEYTIAQKTATGWNFVGNQQQYNVTIQSFIQKRTSLNSGNGDLSRYESGIDIAIPLGAAGTPNPANLTSASVTGPGITGKIWYVLPAQAGEALLSIARAPQTSVPTGGLTSNTQAWGYRWSWQTLPGTTGIYQPSPNNLGQKYAPAPIDVKTVPQFATYTVTFYDASGTQLGQTSVINPTPNIAASDGVSMPWQTISTDSLNSLLLQGGSQTGSIKAANMAWSTLLGGQNLAPIVTSVQLTTQGSLATQNVVGWGPGPAYNATGHYTGTAYAGVDQTGTVQCQSCSFAALTAGVTRNLDLQSNYGAVALDEHWNATATAGIQTN